jgi:hypothetical protein
VSAPSSKSHAIRLPSGRRVSVGTYVRAWKTLKSLPANRQVEGWDLFPAEAGAILRQMERGLHDRINCKDPNREEYDEAEFWLLWRLSRTINGTRIIIRPGDVPKQYREQLRHRITWED